LRSSMSTLKTGQKQGTNPVSNFRIFEFSNFEFSNFDFRI